jgi:DNA helicase-2/ATP-dependent DNA helicase PcrA
LVEAPSVAPLNEEKLHALRAEGNVLVIANPGTGKTLLLAQKYVQLVLRDIRPEQILCLTYTNKATDEMRQAIVKALREAGHELDLSRIKVTTFHAYALDAIGGQETISNNLLRYAIYKYLVDHRILNYGEEYLVSTIVPKIEDSIRYLKSFGIMPDNISLVELQRRIKEYRGITKEEMDRYAAAFLDIFRHYEAVKAGKGIDYADMLLEFVKLKEKPQFKYALVDELQDASAIEAEEVLQSCERFFVVGDKKQAIFAFQGGSIVNFHKFENSSKPILSENFRSTNEILSYARAFFVAKTKDPDAKTEMRDLRNSTKAPGPKPKVYGVSGDDVIPTACELVQGLRSEGKRVAVIARTNYRIRDVSEELGRRGIEHSSTYFQASDDAHWYVVRFLLGVFSDKVEDIKNAMFTPFFPVALRAAFSLAQLEGDEFLRELPIRCPEFQRMRDRVKKLPDVNTLFRKQIIPVAVSYGREYLLAALDLQKAFAESIRFVGELDLDAVITYLRSSDLAADESQKEREVVLTTVHKAKGRQFETVVYLPQAVRGRDNFQDEVVKQILATRHVNVEEELEEEPLRIDFVAITRAKDELYIVTEEPQDYLNSLAESAEAQLSGVAEADTPDKLKRAFNLFVNGETEKAKELMEDKGAWLRGFVKDWFDQLDHVSFSSLPGGGTARAAENYLISNILDVQFPSTGLEIGSQVHEIASAILQGQEYEVPQELRPFVENLQGLLTQVKKDYPELVATEHEIVVPLERLVGDGEGMDFQGRIDAIFKSPGGAYLLVDWKTDKDEGRASSHRQQLQAYRHAFSISNNTPVENVRIAIGYVGLRGRVNLNRAWASLDQKQPSDLSFETFKARVAKVLQWKRAPDSFLVELGETSKDLICRAVQEEFASER